MWTRSISYSCKHAKNKGLSPLLTLMIRQGKTDNCNRLIEQKKDLLSHSSFVHDSLGFQGCSKYATIVKLSICLIADDNTRAQDHAVLEWCSIVQLDQVDQHCPSRSCTQDCTGSFRGWRLSHKSNHKGKYLEPLYGDDGYLEQSHTAIWLEVFLRCLQYSM